MAGARDRYRTSVRKATGETDLASGVRVGGLYLSPHQGRVGQGGVSIGGELAVALMLRVKVRCSEVPVCADRWLLWLLSNWIVRLFVASDWVCPTAVLVSSRDCSMFISDPTCVGLFS